MQFSLEGFDHGAKMFPKLCLAFFLGVVLVQLSDSAPSKERKLSYHHNGIVSFHHNGIVNADGRSKRAIDAVNADMVDSQDRPVDAGRRRHKHRFMERINELLTEQGRSWEDLTSEERYAMKEQIRNEERYIMKTPGKDGRQQLSKEDRKEKRKESRKEQRQQARLEENNNEIKEKKGKGRKEGKKGHSKKGGKKGGRFDGMTEELKRQLHGQIIAIKHDANMSTLEKKEAIRDLIQSARQA